MLFLFSLFLVRCAAESGDTPSDSEDKPSESKESGYSDDKPRVTGIGGIFFKSRQPDSLKQWYSDRLGIVLEPFGAVFESRNARRPEEPNYLSWSIMSDSTDYFDPSEKPFMVNYRVQHIEALVEQLKENGVTVVDSITTYDYGKFVHILDPEGNAIELWEPVDSVLTEYGSKTNY